MHPPKFSCYSLSAISALISNKILILFMQELLLWIALLSIVVSPVGCSHLKQTSQLAVLLQPSLVFCYKYFMLNSSPCQSGTGSACIRLIDLTVFTKLEMCVKFHVAKIAHSWSFAS